MPNSTDNPYKSGSATIFSESGTFQGLNLWLTATTEAINWTGPNTGDVITAYTY